MRHVAAGVPRTGALWQHQPVRSCLGGRPRGSPEPCCECPSPQACGLPCAWGVAFLAPGALSMA